MKISRILLLFVTLAFVLGLLACTLPSDLPATPRSGSNPATATEKRYEDLIVGYAQLGAESEWRVANTISIKETAEKLGVELRFLDAQQKQDNQIEAVRKLIIQKVDVIGISPIVETGWEEVFQEAKNAGIPIILVDRRAAVPEDLYVSYLGSDFLEEGRNAARIMVKLVNGRANIVELVGTIDSAPANDRYTGFREVLAEYPGMKIIDSQSGDFTRARGKEAMAAFLQKYGKVRNTVLSQARILRLSPWTPPGARSKR
jgi:simple sugar transport system substrate-binding protein